MRRRCRTSRPSSRRRRFSPPSCCSCAMRAHERRPDFITATIASIKTAAGRQAGVSPAIASKDGEASEIVVPVKDNTAFDAIRQQPSRLDIARDAPHDLSGYVTGRGPDRRSRRSLRRDRRRAVARRNPRGVRHPDRRLSIAAATVLVLLTSLFALCASIFVDLAPGQGRSRRAQRPGPGHPVHPGHRRRDRLFAALRLPISGSAARQREALGCDGSRRSRAPSRRSWPRPAPSFSAYSACCSAISIRTRRSDPSARSALRLLCSLRSRCCPPCCSSLGGPHFGRCVPNSGRRIRRWVARRSRVCGRGSGAGYRGIRAGCGSSARWRCWARPQGCCSSRPAVRRRAPWSRVIRRRATARPRLANTSHRGREARP